MDDDLIPALEEHPLGRLRLVVIGLFLLSTAGVGIWDFAKPPEVQNLAGSDAAARKQREGSATIKDGTWMQLLDEDLARQSNLKAFGTPWYAGFLLATLDEAGDEAIVGREGWLFLESRAVRPRASVPATTKIWARAFATLDRQLRRHGSRLVVMPVPRRAVFCKEFLPDGYDPDVGLEPAFHTALRDAGLETIDLRPAFATHPVEDIFYRRDTHWSRKAQWIAAGVAVDTLGIAATEQGALEQLLPQVDAPNVQALIRYAGLEPGTTAQRFWQPEDFSPSREPKDPRQRRARGPEDAPIALVGTSFSIGENFLLDLRVRATQPIRSESRRGFRASDTLSKLIRNRERPHATILLEVMLDTIGPTGRESSAQRYTREFEFLTHLGRQAGPAFFPESPLALEPQHGNLVLPMNRLLTSGDGVASLRLERPAGVTQTLRVVTRTGDLQWNVKWPAQEATLLLPILTLDSGSPSVRWTVRGLEDREFSPTHARLVSEFDLNLREPLEASAATGPTSDSAVRIREFPLPTSIERNRSALQYLAGPWAGSVRIELVGSDGECVTLANGDLVAHGQALVDLAPHQDRSWSAIRVTTTFRSNHRRANSALKEKDVSDQAFLVPLGTD